jgi:UDPglucose 6-dehydrogenase
MNICVQGLWHLGSIISSSLASKQHEVIGLDSDKTVIDNLNIGKAPILEPGLNDLLKNGIDNGNLSFTNDYSLALSKTELLWVAFDTPVDEDDNANTRYIEEQILRALPFLNNGVTILVSSQMPVGSVKKLEKIALGKFPERKFFFACSPENLRLGKSLEIFLNPDRIVVGVKEESTKKILKKLLTPITEKIEWMSVESAEMTKHAINAFLATSVTFINEIASICELVGVNAKEVERGLKSDSRIGSKAYLSPGGPIAGGTLTRDISFLKLESKKNNLSTPLISAVLSSNNEHKNWVRRKLQEQFFSLSGISVAIWGLTYKPHTDTLRRSLAVELIDWLISQNAKVFVYDPVVKKLPKHWKKKITHCKTSLNTLLEAQALVIGTDWSEFKQISNKLSSSAKQNLVIIDPNHHLDSTMLKADINYITVGKPIK